MSEVCLLPSPSYSRGRACCAQSQHKQFMKKRFSKSVCNIVANIPEARARVFSPKSCCPPHSSLHLPNIHHPHLLLITSNTSSIPSSTPSSLDLHLHLHHHCRRHHHHHHCRRHHHHHHHLHHLQYICLTYITYTTYTFVHQLHLYYMLYLQHMHYLHHHQRHYILNLAWELPPW